MLLAAQTVSAQQNMYVLSSDGVVNAMPVSQVNYSTFNVDNGLITITDDGVNETRNNMISASCTVAFAADAGVKTLAVTPEIGVCYSKDNPQPTLNDLCRTIGSEVGNLTFAISSLPSGTTYYYRVYVKLGNEILFGDVCSATTQGTKPADNSKTIGGHRFVDLGLSSGLLWAETNVGAETMTDCGNYYAWGETAAKTNYAWSNYAYGTVYSKMNKYNATDQKTVLDAEDDAASVNWGSSCRMPTNDEFAELRNADNCSWTWTTKTSALGYTVSGYQIENQKNGNWIFLPVSGYRSGTSISNQRNNGYYWSATRQTSMEGFAYYLTFYSGSYRQDYNYRNYGCQVRAVAQP